MNWSTNKYTIGDIGEVMKIRVNGNDRTESDIMLIEHVFNSLDDSVKAELLGDVTFTTVVYNDHHRNCDVSVRFTASDRYAFAECIVDFADKNRGFIQFGNEVNWNSKSLADVVINRVELSYSGGINKGLIDYENYSKWSDVQVTSDDGMYVEDYVFEMAYRVFCYALNWNHYPMMIDSIESVEFLPLSNEPDFDMEFRYYDIGGNCMTIGITVLSGHLDNQDVLYDIEDVYC